MRIALLGPGPSGLAPVVLARAFTAHARGAVAGRARSPGADPMSQMDHNRTPPHVPPTAGKQAGGSETSPPTQRLLDEVIL